MFKLDYNPVKARLQKKMAALSEEQKRLCIKPLQKNENLFFLKRTRQPKRNGDIFVCSLNGKVFYYGKILNSNIQNKDPKSWYNGCLLIVLFKEKTSEKNLNNYHGDYNSLIEGPYIVTEQYWSNGWFETVGNIPLTADEENLDYGLYKEILTKEEGMFYKVNGDIVDHFPKYFELYGVKTLTGIYSHLRRESILDPTLLIVD